MAQIPSFPGAVGYGNKTVGGRGGTLYEVTNLNNSGPGSFREACEASGPRIVVFRTGGEIKLTGSIKISNPNITIAGQTAPGDGITIRGADIIIEASEVIIRGLRVRVGTDVVRDWDGIAVISNRNPVNNVIIDHCSVSWAIDENFSTNGRNAPVTNVTFSCNISSEGLNNPSLHSKGDYHAMGMLINKSDVNYVSVVGNLFAHNRERQPKIGNGAIVEVVNNVVYNWENKGTDIAPEASADIIGNYYKTGPSWSGRRYGINIEDRDGYNQGQVYVYDNIGPGRENGTGDEWNAVTGPVSWRSMSPLINIGTPVLPVSEAYDYILDHCGASLPRDAHDLRVVNDVRNGTGGFIGLPSEVGGFLNLDTGTPPTDSDHDGMPDSWENDKGLDPNNSADGNQDRNGDGYTNIEEYINSLFDNVTTTPPSNNPPSISNIFSQSIEVNEDLGPISFTIGDLETASNQLVVTAVSDDQSLVSNDNIILEGSGTSRSITLTPETDQTGSTTITITVSDGTNQTTEDFLLTINPPENNPPTITDISNQTIDQDTKLNPVPFTVNDAETNNLAVTASTDNQVLLPLANITIDGTGNDRTLSATPATGEFGTVGITVTVSDGVNSTSDVFVLTVNQANTSNLPPTISNIPNHSMDQGEVLGPIDFTIGDPDTPIEDLTVTAATDNSTLLNNNNRLVIGGTGADRTLTIEPNPVEFGVATITITVSDGENQAVDNFILTVNEVSGGDNPPFIEVIPEQTIFVNETLGPITFNISDPDTDVNTIEVRAEASNKTLIPTSNITLGGIGANRTITITPATDQVGSTPVTITAFDGVNSFVRTLVVNIIDRTNTPPFISDIPDQTIDQDTELSPVSFTVNDAETNTLTITGSSDNEAILPADNIVIGGNGNDRTVSATPASGQFGTVIITISVSDGTNIVSDDFQLTINAAENNIAPTISAIADQSIDEGQTLGPIDFVIDDVDTPLSDLEMNASCDNTSLIKNTDISIAGSGGNRNITLNPVSGEWGSANISVTVSDGKNEKVERFKVTVNETSNEQNAAPEISVIADHSIEQGETLGPIEFTISDDHTVADDLEVKATSDNTSLIRNTDILIAGSGGNRNITLNPVSGKWGSANISVTVSDGGNETVETFEVKVSQQSDQEEMTFSITVIDADCNDNNGSIQLEVTGGVPPYKYSWSNGSTSSNISNLASGTYNLTVTDDKGNQRTASFIVNKADGPETPIITKDQNVLTSSNAYSYQWYLNGSPIKDANSRDLEATESGDYAVEVIDENGCSTFSDEVNVTIDSFDTNTDTSSLSLYPNPIIDQLTIDMSLNESKNRIWVKIYSLNGQPVFKKDFGNSNSQIFKEEIDLNNIKPGIYIIRIKVNNEVITRRIIKQ
jgi:hypothetical protein